MRKIISTVLLICLIISCAAFCGCSASEECEYESLIAALREVRDAVPDEDMDEEEAEGINNITACVYGDEEEYYELKVTDDFIALFDGEFTKSDSYEGKKILSVTVGMQYEITFFEGSDAMIYYGFCGVFQSDRQYYKYKLTDGVSALREFIISNGNKLNLEDK